MLASVVLAITAAANNPIDDAIADLLPDLRGKWNHSRGTQCTVTVLEPAHEPAKRPFSSYNMCCEGETCLRCSVAPQLMYPHVGAPRIACVDGRAGNVVGAEEVRWDDEHTMSKTARLSPSGTANVTKVHMIYMNHYDVGYTSYINNVDNMYMHQYFNLAATTAQEMRAAKNSTDRFIYTTHAWLMQRFLECPCPQAPAAPSTPIGGVWSSGQSLFYASDVTDSESIVVCLTTDFHTPGAGGCGWNQAQCATTSQGASCKFDNGQSLQGKLSGDSLVFSNGETWTHFSGNLSGLWFGPSDSQDFYIMGHNATNGSLTVWWDSNISNPLWHYGQGSMSGSTVSLLIPDYSKTPIVGNASADGTQIAWATAGVWHRHSSPCLVEECMPASCPARDLQNPYSEDLTCPTEAELAAFTAAVDRGDIVWHAGPFNWQPENMVPELFEAGIDLVRRMDQRFYKGAKVTKTMSVRDVIYVTRSVIPLLNKYGITGLTIGSNGADFPPQVPKLHRWVDDATGTDVIVAYHPFGYGGYGVSDCAIAPNGVALCTEFRTDNSGPPANVGEVEQSLSAVRKEFPGANVITSTFDAFIEDVMPVKDQLPVVNLEIGDTWIYGNPSDPLKMAQFRALQRVWLDCMSNGQEACQPTNPVIQNFTWALLKAPEHTWGTPGISGWGGGDSYNVTTFRASLNQTAYLHAAASWAEQRFFNELAVRSLEEADHPLAAPARAAMNDLVNVGAPDTTGLTSVPLTQPITFSGTGTVVTLGADGSMVGLEDKGVAWASVQNPLGLFTYQTLNETEWVPFTYSYINGHGESGGFCKPGSNNYSESAIFKPTLTELWVAGSASSATALVAKMDMPTKACTTYGSYSTVYLNVTVSRPTSGGALALDLTYSTLGKQPTMIGESTSISFNPQPKLVPKTNASAWTVEKLGQSVDPEGVGDGGNQYCHGTYGGVTAATESGTFQLASLDAINVNPITNDYPVGNPLPASYLESDAKSGTGLSQLKPGSVTGMAFNLHNNLWNTNYALFWPVYDPLYCTTPYDCKTANAKWRFQMQLG